MELQRVKEEQKGLEIVEFKSVSNQKVTRAVKPSKVDSLRLSRSVGEMF